MSKKWIVILSVLLMATAVLAASTWSYDGDVFPPADTPAWALAGSTSYRGLGTEGSTNYLWVNTNPSGASRSIYWTINAGANWNVTTNNGYTVEWRVKTSSVVNTDPGACTLFVGNSVNYASIRVFRNITNGSPLYVAVQDSGAGSTEVSKVIGNTNDWHTYRINVKGSTATLYLDKYPWPILTKSLAAGGADKIFFGDPTGVDNGLYYIDYIRSWQSGIEPSPVKPDGFSSDSWLFLAEYDGTTGNSGLDADYAVGSTVAAGTGAQIDSAGKFDQSMDSSPSGLLTYQTTNNFNVSSGTIEMWIQTDNWADGGWGGFFNLYGTGCDIRMFKRSNNSFHCYMSDGDGNSWQLQSAELNLDANWHHLAWTWDFNANVSAIYVDGAIVDDSVYLGGSLTSIDFQGTLTSTFQVGSFQNSYPFNGLIDEFLISNIDLYGGQPFTPPTQTYIPPQGTLIVIE